MNKDRVEGAAKTTVGRIKEGAGKIIGDQKMATEGKIEKNAGKVQNAVGGLEDAITKSAKKADREARRN